MSEPAREITTTNPATGAPLKTYPAFSRDDVDAAITSAHGALGAWSDRPVADRAATIAGLAAVLRDRHEELAQLVTAEMGKPIGEARAEVEKSAWQCDWYGTEGPELLTPEPIETYAASSYVAYEPLGVIYAVMPWNFPFWQVFRFAIPAMLAGNTVLLKHAPNVTGCALAIEELFEAAGFPPGALRALVVADEDVVEVTEHVLADARVAAATVTGSTRAGAHVAATAGQHLKKVVLELGGSDPFVVLADADLATAAVHATNSRLMCTGQTCIAAKRIIVHRDVAEEFERLFVEAMRSRAVGDPVSDETQMGPLARADLLATLEGQVDASVEAGARLLTGGHRIDGPGFYFEPTVLTDVTADMPVLAEETFGPVAALVVVEDDEEAIAVANDSVYGLAASVWSRDPDRALEVGGRIESGALFINSFVSSDPRLPFGGIKRSGFGRELGASGVREFTNARSTWIAPAK